MSSGMYERSADNAFGLGTDIEELYSIFGEGILVMSGGLDQGLYELVEAKAHRVRDLLLSFDVGFPLVQRVEELSSRVARAGGGAIDAAVTMRVAEALSELMGEVRSSLGDDVGVHYDSGIMTARLALCLRALRDAAGARDELRSAYELELARVVPIVVDMIATGDAVGAPLSRALRDALRALGDHLAAYDGGSPAWRAAADARAEAAFTAIGAVVPNVDRTQSAIDDLAQRRSELRRDLDRPALVQAQQALLDECQRTVGPDHELTLGVYSDLAMTHVHLGDLALGADLALDAAERSVRTFGERHALSAYLYVRAFLTRYASDEQRARAILQERLGWLIDADASLLPEDLASVRAHLFGLLGWDAD